MATKTKYGKKFEKIFSTRCSLVEDTCIIRLPDQTAGYKGAKNICDFIVYHFPLQFLMECKTVANVSMSFNNITDKQWEGLIDSAKIKGVIPGVVVWFRKSDVTKFYHIKELQEWRDKGHKSINYKEKYGITLTGEKKRLYTDYDMGSFFRNYTRIYNERTEDDLK